MSISKLLKSPSHSIPKSIKITPTKISNKVPAKISKSMTITKNDILSIMATADFRKLLCEILQEEIKFIDNKVEDLREDELREDPMDIDVTRLENAKDLLALEGKVNGISIQCLADTCANASFIQKGLAEELGLDIDESKKYNITGAPGSSKTFGMIKNVSIELAPDCIIVEDLAVLGEYKYREIGLSRAYLRRYNYDVHES